MAFFEKMWSSPGFSKLTSNYTDLTVDHAANAVWCEFIAEKIRGIVKDPETAERLIPKDHRFAEKRPPFVTGYYEVYNNPNVSLVDLTADADRADDRERDRDDRRRAGVRHHRVGDRLRLRHRCADAHGDPRPGRSRRSRTTGPTVRRRSSASRPPASRTSSSPAARTPRPATTRGTTATRWTSSPTRSSTCATTATTPSRSTPRPRSGGRTWSTPVRRHVPLRGEQLLLRDQHPREAPPVPPELGRPAEALQGDRRGSSTTTTRRSGLLGLRSRQRWPSSGPAPAVRRWRPASTGSRRSRAAAAGAR